MILTYINDKEKILHFVICVSNTLLTFLWQCSCKQLIGNAQPVSWAFLCAIRDVLHFSVVFDVGLCVCNELRTPKSDDCAFCCWVEGPALAQPGWFTVLSTETDFKEISFRPEDHKNITVFGAWWLESQNGRMVSQLPRVSLWCHIIHSGCLAEEEYFANLAGFLSLHLIPPLTTVASYLGFHSKLLLLKQVGFFSMHLTYCILRITSKGSKVDENGPLTS